MRPRCERWLKHERADAVYDKWKWPSNNGNHNNHNHNNNNANNSNNNAPAVDGSYEIEIVRERIAELDKDLLELACKKASFGLQLDSCDRGIAVSAKNCSQYQDAVHAMVHLKERRDTLADILADLMQYKEGATADSAGQVSTANTSDFDEYVLEIKDDMPRFGCDNKRYYTTSTDDFLYRFEVYLKTFLGPVRFERECFRYMVMLTEDVPLQNDLFEEFECRDKPWLTFEECANVFRDFTAQAFN
ncbi:hypothetical protein BGZ68_000956 [Mortierella alpina]|nr:hypothetical protein BGZ68_000956 [Mortierella alpina]